MSDTFADELDRLLTSYRGEIPTANVRNHFTSPRPSLPEDPRRPEALVVWFADEVAALAGQDGWAIATGRLINLIADEEYRGGNLEKAAKFRELAAFYPGRAEPRITRSREDTLLWVTEMAAFNELSAILAEHPRDAFPALRKGLTDMPQIEYGLSLNPHATWNHHFVIDYGPEEAALFEGYQGHVVPVGQAMKLAARDLEARDPTEARRLRTLADRYFLDDSIEVPLPGPEGNEDALIELRSCSRREAAEILAGARAVRIPGSFSIGNWEGTSRYASDDSLELIGFRYDVSDEECDVPHWSECILVGERWAYVGEVSPASDPE